MISFYDNYGENTPPERAVAMVFHVQLSTRDWDTACVHVRRSTTLKHIEFRIIGDSKTTYEYLSRMFATCHEYLCPLESIVFPRSKDLLRRRSLEIVVNFMRSRPDTLWSLGLWEANLAPNGCIKMIIDAMNTSVRIGTLKLRGFAKDGEAAIDDDDVESILTSSNSQYLEELQIHGLVCKYDALSVFLKREDTNIKQLNVRGNHVMNVECAQMLLGSIPANSTLKHIQLGKLFSSGDGTLQTAYGMLKDLVCNQSNFTSLCQSNHNLFDIGYSMTDMKNCHQDLRLAMEINERENCSVNERRRSKLRAFYFQGEFDIQPFIAMDVELMPNVLELVTMSEECLAHEKKGRLRKGAYVSARNGHLGSIYRIVRNCHIPELFSFSSQDDQKMQRLKEENDVLKEKMTKLEQDILSLKQQNEQLAIGRGASSTNKRTKPDHE